jgi:Ca-activated chloride channel family protein
LINNLPKNSHIAIVAYAGSAGLVLGSTDIDNKEKIFDALDDLEAGGSTAGGEGIKLAYKVAEENFIKGGNNRIILATDGDFNVGVSSTSDLIKMVQEKKKTNIFLTVLGFGMGNYKDGRMEEISNRGNGNYFYIDSYKEAKKVFKKELIANLFTIAKDVKVQVEFNPSKVKAYRLIGYANRLLNAEDFNNDKIDAGELGAGHTVTAFYEIIDAASDEKVLSHDDLKYQKTTQVDTNTKELMTLKLRYKPIDSDVSKLISKPINEVNKSWKEASKDFRFAASVAGFGMELRNSEYKGNMSLKLIRNLAKQDGLKDPYKNEFITLVNKFGSLKK